MPIDKSWGEEQKVEYVAQITDLREEMDTFEDNDGVQKDIRRIYVDLDDVNPAVLSRLPVRFRASTHRSANWMKWLSAIEHLGFKCKDDPNNLIGNFIHIREETMGNDIDGEYIEWVFPRPVAFLTSEAAAQEVFETLPEVEVAAGEVDLDTRIEIASLARSLLTIKDEATRKTTFESAVVDILPQGITAEEAWNIAQAELEE